MIITMERKVTGMQNKITNVMAMVFDPRRLNTAWQQVKKNAGSAGIDNVTIKDFMKRSNELAPIVSKKLRDGTYRFKPARRVFIPKDGTSKMRPLGIPVVMDRIVSQSMNQVFEEIFGKDFSDFSYGFRPGKNQHMAIKYVQSLVKDGYNWCASIDLKSFFDEIPHDLILKLIRRKISDEKLVTLVARALKAGVIIDGKFEKTTKGVPQGSPLSPMLSNIVLNELDKELEKRGLKFCRWADDFIILVKSERASLRVLNGITKYLENNLSLKVNNEKSKATRVNNITFLGFQIYRKMIKISNKARKKFKEKVKLLTKRNNPLSMYKIIKDLNRVLIGWVNYFKIQEFKKVLHDLDKWLRCRLRSMQLKKWKKPKKFQRILIKAGYSVDKAKKVWVRMNRFQSVYRKEVVFVMDLKWFRAMKVVFLHDYTK